MISPALVWDWISTNIVAAAGGFVALFFLVSSALHNWHMRRYVKRIALALERNGRSEK